VKINIKCLAMRPGQQNPDIFIYCQLLGARAVSAVASASRQLNKIITNIISYFFFNFKILLKSLQVRKMAEAGIPIPNNWNRISYFHCALLGYFLGLLTATVSSEVIIIHIVFCLLLKCCMTLFRKFRTFKTCLTQGCVTRFRKFRKLFSSKVAILSDYLFLKAKETKKCLHRDIDDDDLVEFCQL
jgi:hypothetical protein